MQSKEGEIKVVSRCPDVIALTLAVCAWLSLWAPGAVKLLRPPAPPKGRGACRLRR